jgi:hypothetical protein
MDSAVVFQVLNSVVMPWWLLWLIVPGSAWSQRAASHGAVFVVLGAVYVVFLVGSFATSPSTGGFSFDFETLRGALSTDVGFLAGWTHYIAFDLFAGAWIVRDSTRHDVDPRVFLFFTLMTGPLGLGSYLLRRWFRLRGFGGIGAAPAA